MEEDEENYAAGSSTDEEPKELKKEGKKPKKLKSKRKRCVCVCVCVCASRLFAILSTDCSPSI
jgi:hypothetical protein